MKKLITLLLALFLVVGLLVGCSGSSAKTYTIGVSCGDLSNPYFVSIVEGIRERAKELGNVTIVEADPKQDPAQQVSVIENFVTQGVDAIIVISFNTQVTNEALAAVLAEGKIKVLVQSDVVDNTNVNVTAKNYDMGYTLGEAAGQYIASDMGGNASVAILNYPDVEIIIDRENGMRDALAKFAPNAKVVATAKAGTPDQGTTAAETILQSNPDVDVILAINDAGALGAYAAVEAGKNTTVRFIGGIDALPEALAKIKEAGIYRATVDLNAKGNGRDDVDLIVKLLTGVAVEKDQGVSLKAVTAANISDY